MHLEYSRFLSLVDIDQHSRGTYCLQHHCGEFLRDRMEVLKYLQLEISSLIF